MDADVVIVGAGAAGLMAARELSRAGKSVVVLEARDRIGGRIYPLAPEKFGYEAMGGAEFLHGNAPITKALITEAGLTTTHITEWWDVRDGDPALIEHGPHIDKLSPHDALIESKLKELTEDITVAEFLDAYFPGDTFVDLRDIIRMRVESYDAAEIKKFSSFSLRDELLNEWGWKQLSLKEGYGSLMRFLEQEATKNGAIILLNKVVVEVELTTTGVQVRCVDNSTYQASKVLVTVPLPVIKDITFTPAIPKKLEAAEAMGFGPAVKILLNFNSKWWTGAREQKFERMFFMFSNEKIPTWWTQYPAPYTTLTGWVAGPAAAELSESSDENITQLALESLSNIFTISLEELRKQLVASHISNWRKDPYARGAYSYTTPKSAAAVAELTKPVNNKLYFAGEAVCTGEGSSTVEGALASGQAAAKKILDLA